MNRILVAIDFSPIAEVAVRYALSLAQSLGIQLTLLHVAAPDPDFVGYEAGPQSVRDARAHELRAEHVELQQTAAELRATGVEVEALLVQGETVEMILHEAEKLNADLIVLGSHGHGRIFEALVGSVSDGVIRNAKCPVVIVPHRMAHS